MCCTDSSRSYHSRQYRAAAAALKMDAPFVVTGGTGFLGVALVQLLLSRGHSVRVLVRRSDPALVGRAGVELALGDVTDASCVERACAGARGVFHLVGIVEHSRGAAAAVYKINVDGTVNVMEAAVKHQLKVVFVSTSGTVGVSRDRSRVATDRSDFATLIKDWPYYDSKRQAEIVAREIASKNALNLAIIRPSSILGPGDMGLQTAKSLEYYRHKGLYKHLSRKVPYIPDGGLNFCDVRDVAAACLAAMLRDSANGRSFLIGGPNMTLKEFFQAAEEVSGVKRAWLSLPYVVGWVVISSLHHGGNLLGNPYHVDPVVVEMANHFWYIDSQDAIEILGYAPRDWRETLADSVAYISKHGHLMGLPYGVPSLLTPSQRMPPKQRCKL